jgi:hypothetical protein
MTKHIIIILSMLLVFSQTLMAEAVNIDIIVDPDLKERYEAEKEELPLKKLYRESFVEVEYKKELVKDLTVYRYTVKNIGDVPIGKVKLGYNKPDLTGCEIPPANIVKLETSLPEWTVTLEKQEENINKCISAEDVLHIYYLESGNNMIISVYLSKDDPIFEKLHWTVIFGRAPMRLEGVIKPNIN